MTILMKFVWFLNLANFHIVYSLISQSSNSKTINMSRWIILKILDVGEFEAVFKANHRFTNISILLNVEYKPFIVNCNVNRCYHIIQRHHSQTQQNHSKHKKKKMKI